MDEARKIEATQANVREFQKNLDAITQLPPTAYRLVLRLLSADFLRRQEGIEAGRIEYF